MTYLLSLLTVKDKQPSNSTTPTVQASTSSSHVAPPAQPTAFQQNADQTVSFVQTEAAALLQERAPAPGLVESESGVYLHHTHLTRAADGQLRAD